MNRSHTHCPDCGAPLPETDWPRTCRECENTHFLNPTPVAVLIQPVDGGVLTVRRDIPPHRGELALPGGYIDLGESWEEAAARELREETGIEVDPEDVEAFEVESAPDGTVLIFGRAPYRSSDVIPDECPSDEVSEIVVVHEPRELGFSLHTSVQAQWFAR